MIIFFKCVMVKIRYQYAESRSPVISAKISSYGRTQLYTYSATAKIRTKRRGRERRAPRVESRRTAVQGEEAANGAGLVWSRDGQPHKEERPRTACLLYSCTLLVVSAKRETGTLHVDINRKMGSVVGRNDHPSDAQTCVTIGKVLRRG